MNRQAEPLVPEATHPRALLDLYEASVANVYRYLLKSTGGSIVLAEDLTQEVFLAAAKRLPDSEPIGEGWLIRVARNKMIDHFRKEERERRKLRLLDGEASDVEESFDVGSVTHDEACQLLQALGPEQRAAVALRYLEDLSIAEVAAHLDRTVAATESLLARARRRLRELSEGMTDA